MFYHCYKLRTITIGKNVSTIEDAFGGGCSATKLILKTKKLKRNTVRYSLYDSKVKTIKVEVGTKATNRQYVKKYKKIFTKKNAGKQVTVK